MHVPQLHFVSIIKLNDPIRLLQNGQFNLPFVQDVYKDIDTLY